MKSVKSLNLRSSFASFPSVLRSRVPEFLLSLFCFLLCSCSTRPLHGGRSLVTPSAIGGLAQTLVQSDNPSQPSRQSQHFVRTRTYTMPPGTRLDPAPNIGPIPSYLSHSPGPNQKSPAPQLSTLNSQPLLLTEREECHANTELGAAQKDTARELGAKLSSLKSIVWVGVALFILGLVSLFWPPLKAIIGSVTTSAAIAAGGLALIVLPTLVVGNELLILGGVTVAVGGWFLAHRHGELRGQLRAAAPKSTEGGRHGHLRGTLAERQALAPSNTPTPKPKPLSMALGS